MQASRTNSSNLHAAHDLSSLLDNQALTALTSELARLSSSRVDSIRLMCNEIIQSVKQYQINRAKQATTTEQLLHPKSIWKSMIQPSRLFAPCPLPLPLLLHQLQPRSPVVLQRAWTVLLLLLLLLAHQAQVRLGLRSDATAHRQPQQLQGPAQLLASPPLAAPHGFRTAMRLLPALHCSARAPR